MTETQKRIKAYKAALPGLKERVTAVALLLAMSMAMMTSATFAWLTISRAPEVSGVSTTLAANGNLEIALVAPDGSEPGESKVGDSSAAQGQSVVNANLTWGNMINLSDPSYGLENLTLRPAQLNTAALLTNPLYGAMYAEDGRITRLNSSFGYATWNEPDGEIPGYFGVSTDYGVRAISSTKIEAVGAAQTYLRMVSEAEQANLAAGTAYADLANNKVYMQSLATLMGLYMTDRMNDADSGYKNPTCEVADLENLRDMYADFLDCFNQEADAIARLIELQLFLTNDDGSYQSWTRDMVFETSQAQLNSLGIQISNFDQFKKDRNTIAADWAKLADLCSSGGDKKWNDSGISGIVNNLVIVGTCTVSNGKTSPTTINSIGATAALDYIGRSDNVATITNGILYNYEQRTGSYLLVKQLSIKVSVKRGYFNLPNQEVKADIVTSAPRDYNLFNNDLTYAKGLNDGSYGGGVAVAEDTYGLAVDFWIRTNAESSYLTLEGNVLTQTSQVQAKTTDTNGNEVDLYTVTVETTDENGEYLTYSADLYQSNGTWYLASSHNEVTEEYLNGATPVKKMNEVVNVIGYEGENRIWTEDSLLSVDATTQGSGSCYVYYADTPEDQARSLRLLEAFNVAFVDAEGKRMATAVMDTKNFYAESGRVIVPLVLSSNDSISLGEDVSGETQYAVTALEKNVPLRVTAIVYLDGTKLTNEEVLSASDIQGQLNIQFGSSQSLEPIENEALANKEHRISASVDVTEFDYDTHVGDMTANVSVHVEGDDPTSITAFFMRAISSTQGSREEKMTFTKDPATGDWVSSYTFTTPGTYVLRNVQLDGQDYSLATVPTVVVKGFALKSLSCQQATGGQINIMSAAGTSTIDMSLQFAASDVKKLPTKVQGRFLRDDGIAVNVPFKYNATTGGWTGQATFLVSGNYTMQYLILDGEYVEIDQALHQTAHVVLGMRVAVYTTSPHSFKYEGESMPVNQKILGMQVKIFDNAGNEMTGMTGVKLTYNMRGSATKKMDTDLSWTGFYYVGELHTTGPGVWQFGSVTVGGNTLTASTTSPTFTITSPEPPDYFGHYTNASQYAPSNNAVMSAQITHSSAATVEAKIIRVETGEEYWVQGIMGSTEGTTAVTNWTFPVPKNANGYQDGNWQLTELKVYGVFDSNGKEYTSDAPLIVDVSDTNNVAKVVSQVHISFPEDKSQDFGLDQNGNTTAAFMTSHTISGLSVKITDFEGQPLSGIRNVKLSFTYSGKSLGCGGYESANLIAGGTKIEVPLSGSGTYTQTANATIQYAGEYETTLEFTVNGTKVSYGYGSNNVMPANAPEFTVWSITPTVQITAIDPTGSVTAYNGSSTFTATNSMTGTSATVYTQYSQSSGCTKYNRFIPSSVTINLQGMGNADSAALIFSGGSATPLYSTMASNTTSDGSSQFAWTSDGTCRRYVGYVKRNNGGDDKTPAGTITATKLTLYYNNIAFEVPLSPSIVINNPN